MMSKEKPVDFAKRYDIVGCFIEHDGKFLLLRRQPHKANGGKWGLPAGKVDAGETTLQAVLRETVEETGIKLPETDVTYFDSLYVRDGDFDIEWHMFGAAFESLPVVHLSEHEHSDFCWVTPLESLQMDLIHDQPESIRLFYKLS
jgi:8-oxo-dGTP pyrophosphatase MutT (NUDIX family)